LSLPTNQLPYFHPSLGPPWHTTLPGLSRANVLQLVTCPLFSTSVISLCSNSHYQLSSEPWVLDLHSLDVPNLKLQESYLILFGNVSALTLPRSPIVLTYASQTQTALKGVRACRDLCPLRRLLFSRTKYCLVHAISLALRLHVTKICPVRGRHVRKIWKGCELNSCNTTTSSQVRYILVYSLPVIPTYKIRSKPKVQSLKLDIPADSYG